MYLCAASLEVTYAEVPANVMAERPVLVLMIVPVGLLGSG
jgi:hypothetical protein